MYKRQDFFGAEIPADMMGKPLAGVIAGDAPVRRYALFGYHGAPVGITDGRWVLLRAVADSTVQMLSLIHIYLTAGQIPGWTESHADEIYYGGRKKQGPGPEDPDLRGGPGGKNYYSPYEGQLKLDERGVNLSLIHI